MAVAPGKDIPEASPFEGIPCSTCWEEETPGQKQELSEGPHLPASLRASCPFKLTLALAKRMDVRIILEGKFGCRVKQRGEIATKQKIIECI